MFLRHCIVKILANASALAPFLPRIVAKTQHRKFFEPKQDKIDCFSRRQVAGILTYFKTDNVEKRLFYLILASSDTDATAYPYKTRYDINLVASATYRVACNISSLQDISKISQEIYIDEKTTCRNKSFFLARPKGFEPPFFRIGICCVIQLRHGRICYFIIISVSDCFFNSEKCFIV